MLRGPSVETYVRAHYDLVDTIVGQEALASWIGAAHAPGAYSAGGPTRSSMLCPGISHGKGVFILIPDLGNRESLVVHYLGAEWSEPQSTLKC